MNRPCESYPKGREGARQLGRNLEVILQNPHLALGGGEPGVCKVCGAELHTVYRAFVENDKGGLDTYNITRDPKMAETLKKCQGPPEPLLEQGIHSYPNSWCDCVNDRTISDPSFWEKDPESGFQVDGGWKDREDNLVSPHDYGHMFLQKARYKSAQFWADKDKEKPERKSPMQKHGYA